LRNVKCARKEREIRWKLCGLQIWFRGPVITNTYKKNQNRKVPVSGEKKGGPGLP